MDEAARIFRHQGYDLLCGTRAIDGGRFAPTLVVCKQSWPTRPRTIAIDRGEYLSEAAALDAARAKGIEWISDFGDAGRSTQPAG